MKTRDDLYEDMFRAMNQFHKLKFGDIMQNMNKADFIVMNVIMKKGQDDDLGAGFYGKNAPVSNLKNAEGIGRKRIRGTYHQQK